MTERLGCGGDPRPCIRRIDIVLPIISWMQALLSVAEMIKEKKYYIILIISTFVASLVYLGVTTVHIIMLRRQYPESRRIWVIYMLRVIATALILTSVAHTFYKYKRLGGVNCDDSNDVWKLIEIATAMLLTLGDSFYATLGNRRGQFDAVNPKSKRLCTFGVGAHKGST